MQTVVAISTPPGKGGVAVIRISGADALDIGKKIFKPRYRKSGDFPARLQIYGDIISRGEAIDDGLLTFFPAPGSYTGEDTVEISCHGGVLITKTVLEAAFTAGAVPAGRGEFTRRAFTAGKLSLTETEAIGLLLDAESDAQIRLTRERSRSKLSVAIEDIRSSLVSLLSSVFARIDYPDEDLGDFTDGEVRDMLNVMIGKMDALLSTYKTGHAVTEGIKTVIAGKPNVGKSTLYNLLAGEDAAIVTNIPGTTRDVLERSISIGDVMLRLCDTAGIRDGEVDPVEAIGIERSRMKLDGAELILALFDSSCDIDDADLEILEYIKKLNSAKIAVITKTDVEGNDPEGLAERISELCRFDAVISISAKGEEDEARKRLTDTVTKLFTDERITVGEDAIIASARQHASLLRARDAAKVAKEAIDAGLPQDLAAADIELALGAVGELDGKSVSESVVQDIFAKFCVGK